MTGKLKYEATGKRDHRRLSVFDDMDRMKRDAAAYWLKRMDPNERKQNNKQNVVSKKQR